MAEDDPNRNEHLPVRISLLSVFHVIVMTWFVGNWANNVSWQQRRPKRSLFDISDGRRDDDDYDGGGETHLMTNRCL